MYPYTYTHNTHNGILLRHKKNEIIQFVATWMDLEIIILNDVSQTKTNVIYHLLLESKKNDINEFIQSRNRLTDIENKLMVIKEESEGGINWKFGINR